MIAKLIVHGRDRDHALNLMATALEQVEVVGCATNATFLGALVRDAEFAAGKVDTGLIERRLDALLAAARPETTRCAGDRRARCDRHLRAGAGR